MSKIILKSYFGLAVFIGSLFSSVSAFAYILPYSTRTADYSAWSPATQGDTSTIGMAGATLAVPTSVAAAYSNPSGFAMVTGTASAQINSTTLNDQRIQLSGDPIQSSQWGLGISPDHWGFSMTYYSPQTESGTYVSPNTGDTALTEVSLKEFRLTVARTLFDDHLALGLTGEMLKGVRVINGYSADGYGFSYALSGMYKFPKHILLAASYFPYAEVGPSQNPDYQTVMPGFNRNIIRPSSFGVGVGWMPNRYFKAGASVTWIGSTSNTALFANQDILEGTHSTWVPRIGAGYVFGEFSNFKLEVAAGSYFEQSRLSGYSDRIHFTGGVDANPYFINAGAGFDVSTDYKNFIVSVGVDVIRTARAFNIIPGDPVPPYKAFFPPATEIIPDGLSDPLTNGEEKKYKGPSVSNVAEIVTEVPGNIIKRVEGKPTTVEIREKKQKGKNKRNVEAEKVKLSPSN